MFPRQNGRGFADPHENTVTGSNNADGDADCLVGIGHAQPVSRNSRGGERRREGDCPWNPEPSS